MFRARQYFLFFFLISFLLALLIRLFYLQILSFDRFSAMASEQHNSVLKVEPHRGAIFDRYMEPLALNLDAPSIYCNPGEVKDKERTADMLSSILHTGRPALLEKLGRDKGFVWLERKVDSGTADKIKELRPPGIYFVDETKRRYPNDNMAAHIIGFAGIDNRGLEGLEMLYNEKLGGRPGWRHLVRDAKRRPVLVNEKESIPPQNGYNLVLTIDSVIQYIAEEELENMARKFHASSASVVVMDPVSGKILALANYPDYDLNAFSEAPRKHMKNTAISSVYEPGSVFKIITGSAALEEGVADLDDRLYCENGKYRVEGRILNDYHGYGELSFREIIAKSSNIGTVKVARALGGRKLYEYIRRFGFGEKTGIDLPGEVSGISRPPAAWSRSDITTIPIGQGIAVTSVQLACAVSVIANGGYLMKPYIVDRIMTWKGGVYKKNKPVPKRKVLSERTCEKMKDALRYAVTDGTGRYAASKLYAMCGKTGTAQMVDPEGGYYPDKYNSTFIGFAPLESPAVSIVVAARDPHPVYFGGSVAGPVFKRIAERTLQYMDSGGAGINTGSGTD
ncbi:MAG: penicillin-binding protein [Candidatus Makaraimicrobium thalassicum]|nr:MAG: penicillin-binding protein [Candidatus Omnitrophota bacterium]